MSSRRRREPGQHGGSFGDNEPAAIEWGQKKGEQNPGVLFRVQRQSHKGHKWCESGLVVLPDNSFIGASPDGISTFKCQSGSCRGLEVQCPYRERNSNPKEAAKNGACKDGDDGHSIMISDGTYKQVYIYRSTCKKTTKFHRTWLKPQTTS